MGREGRRAAHQCYRIYELRIARRTLLEYFGGVVVTPVLAHPKETGSMWGMIAKMTLLPGRRDEMIEILKESAANMPGCLTYVVAKDAADENTPWVTEVWTAWPATPRPYLCQP